MPNPLEAAVAAALSGIRNPRLDNDVLSAGMIEDLAVTDDGSVSLTFLLARDDPAQLVRETRRSLKAVEGVREVRIQVREPAPTRPPAGAPQPAGAPGPAAPSPEGMARADLGKVIAISSGKGGVGKSTVSANLAVQLARSGRAVGLMDADVYGPNIPRMLGVSDKPPVSNGRIIPLEAHGVKIMSLGLLIEREAPAIWRGPIIMKIIQQFLGDVDWGTLDYLLVDLPPGTGDAQLSLVQAVQVKAAVIVTTPQEVAIGDALRGAHMFEKVGVPVAGIVENMSWFTCPHCGEETKIFLSGGGERLAEEVGVPLLGQIPLQAGMADLADEGKPIVLAEPDSPAGAAFTALVRAVEAATGGRSVPLPIVTG